MEMLKTESEKDFKNIHLSTIVILILLQLMQAHDNNLAQFVALDGIAMLSDACYSRNDIDSQLHNAAVMALATTSKALLPILQVPPPTPGLSYCYRPVQASAQGMEQVSTMAAPSGRSTEIVEISAKMMQIPLRSGLIRVVKQLTDMP